MFSLMTLSLTLAEVFATTTPMSPSRLFRLFRLPADDFSTHARLRSPRVDLGSEDMGGVRGGAILVELP